MKKNHNLTAVFVVNAIILTLVALRKTYRPYIDKLARKYVELKKEDSIRKSKVAYKRELSKILEEANTKIGDIGELIKETLTAYSIVEINECKVVSSDVKKYLYNTLEKPWEEDLIEYEIPVGFLPELDSLAITVPSCSVTNLSNDISSIPVTKANILKQLIGSIALIIAFHSLGNIGTKDVNHYIDSSIIEELDLFLNEENLDIVIGNSTAIEKGIHPETLEEKIETILFSKDANEEKWNRLFKLKEITLDEKMSQILTLGNSEEILQFIINTNHLTVKQKVWYALLIPNVSFEEVLKNLLTIQSVDQNQVIIHIIDNDMVPFQTLFDAILKIDSLTKEQLMYYFTYYHADYNAVSLDEMVHYVSALECFTQEDKANCIWMLLNENSLIEKEQFIWNFYHITEEEYVNLHYMKPENLDENKSMVLQLLEKVNQEKEDYILSHYCVSKEQLDTVVAGVAAEGAKSYKDLYYVANTIFNRCTSPLYAENGLNPYLQFIAEDQFAVYESGSYLFYLYPRNSTYAMKFDTAKQAVYDMFYAGYDGVVHNYIEFRSWDTVSFSNIYIVENGNRYGNSMDESMRIKYDNLLDKEEGDHKQHTLVKINSLYTNTR